MAKGEFDEAQDTPPKTDATRENLMECVQQLRGTSSGREILAVASGDSPPKAALYTAEEDKSLLARWNARVRWLYGEKKPVAEWEKLMQGFYENDVKHWADSYGKRTGGMPDQETIKAFSDHWLGRARRTNKNIKVDIKLLESVPDKLTEEAWEKKK